MDTISRLCFLRPIFYYYYAVIDYVNGKTGGFRPGFRYFRIRKAATR